MERIIQLNRNGRLSTKTRRRISLKDSMNNLDSTSTDPSTSGQDSH
jgi:hypothetical protein